jgi:hypothetical protein
VRKKKTLQARYQFEEQKVDKEPATQKGPPVTLVARKREKNKRPKSGRVRWWFISSEVHAVWCVAKKKVSPCAMNKPSSRSCSAEEDSVKRIFRFCLCACEPKQIHRKETAIDEKQQSGVEETNKRCIEHMPSTCRSRACAFSIVCPCECRCLCVRAQAANHRFFLLLEANPQRSFVCVCFLFI